MSVALAIYRQILHIKNRGSVQDYAGHGDFLTTFNVYSHSDVSAKKTEMDYITSCFTDLFDSSSEE